MAVANVNDQLMLLIWLAYKRFAFSEWFLVFVMYLPITGLCINFMVIIDLYRNTVSTSSAFYCTRFDKANNTMPRTTTNKAKQKARIIAGLLL